MTTQITQDQQHLRQALICKLPLRITENGIAYKLHIGLHPTNSTSANFYGYINGDVAYYYRFSTLEELSQRVLDQQNNLTLQFKF